MVFQAALAFLAIVIPVVAALGLGIKWGEDRNGKWGPTGARPAAIALSVLLFFVLIYSCASIKQINPAERGVVVKLGVVQDKVLDEGVHYIPGFINSIEVMDVQIHAYETLAPAASRDLQDVATTVTLNYQIDPARSGYVYQNFRRDYIRRIVHPAILEIVKATTATFNADQLIVDRPTVKATIERSLGERLAHSGIRLEAVSITDFQFSEAFSQAIEAKVSAGQRAQEAERLLQQIEVEARQVATRAEGEKNATIQRAEGDKQAAIARAQGEAESIRLRAEAQAKANLLVAQSVTDPLIRWQVASTLAPDIHTIVIPAGSNFILGPEILGGAK